MDAAPITFGGTTSLVALPPVNNGIPDGKYKFKIKAPFGVPFSVGTPTMNGVTSNRGKKYWKPVSS